MSHCPTCNAKVKSGFLGSNELYSEEDMRFVNAFSSEEHSQLCFSCGGPFLEEARKNLRYERRKIKKLKQDLVEHLPIVSIENPPGWNFTVISFISEVSSVSWTLSGTPKSNELACLNKLKSRAIEVGANAIVGTKISYNTHNYILINVYGTAVFVDNPSCLPEDYKESLSIFNEYQYMIDLVEEYHHINLI